MEDFLTQILLYNHTVYNLFKNEFIDSFPLPSKADYKKKIRDIISQCYRRKRHIDEDDSFYYSRKLRQILKEAVTFMEARNYDLAIEIIDVVLLEIIDTQTDDSYEVVNDITT